MLFRQIVNEDLGCASYLIGDPERGRRRGDRPAVGHRALPAPEPDPRRPHRAHPRDPQPRRPRQRPRPARARHRRHHPRQRAGGRRVPARGLRRRLEAGARHRSQIEAVHTPGHRPEHTSFLLRDEGRGGEPWALLSGDSLFVGDVARPDLAVEPREGAARDLPLAAPAAAGPGRRGRGLARAPGRIALRQRRGWTTRPPRRSASSAPTTGPSASMTRMSSSRTRSPRSAASPRTSSASSRSTAVRCWSSSATPAPLSPRAVEVAIADGAHPGRRPHQRAVRRGPHPGRDQRLGVRDRFRDQGRPGGPRRTRADRGRGLRRLRAGRRRAARLGRAAGPRLPARRHDRLALGGPAGGPDRDDRPRRAGRAPGRGRQRDPAAEHRRARRARRRRVRAGHIPGSVHIPFGELPERSGELPRDGTIAAVCSGGKRSGLAASLLQREGFERVLHVANGGVGTWQRQGRPVEAGSSG